MRFALQAAPTLLAYAALAAPATAVARFEGPAAHAARARNPHSRARRRQTCTPQDRRAGRKPDCAPASFHRSPPKPRRTQVASSVGAGNATTAASGQPTAAQAASIAEVLSTPCQNTNLTPTVPNLPLVRAAVLCLINTERADHGELPLQPNRRLEAAAESHGREMIAVNYFEHISPSGITPVDRVREAGYIPNSEVGYVVGENLAWGTLSLSTPETIVNAWIASPEHLANILEAKYRDTGIDVEPEVPKSLAEGVEGGLYTEEFGVIVQ